MNFKYVINCGGYVDHKNKKKNHSTHFLGCKNLIKIFERNKIKLFIHIGSSSEYGNLKSPHIEKIIGNARDVYGKAKLLATQHILKKSHSSSFVLINCTARIKMKTDSFHS